MPVSCPQGISRGVILNGLRAKRISTVCALAVAACAACTRNTDVEEAGTGQVAARLGTEVVTAPEIDNELRLARVPVESRKDPVLIKQMMDQLVLRKYLVQQAIGSKLDLEPNVRLDVLRAREQVLANEYMARKDAANSIGKVEIEKYIAEHPSQFAQRRMMTVEQIRFALGPTTQSLVDANKSMSTLEDVDQKLTSLAIPHNRSVDLLSQSDLPAELTKALKARKPNEVFYARSGSTGLYFKVKSEEAHPLEGEAASYLALQHLKADAYRAQIAEALAAAREEAKYEGAYAKIMATADSPAANRQPNAH